MTRPHVARPDLGGFLDSVYPALFERLDAAFPELGFTRKGNAWTATRWPADFPAEAGDKRPERLMVYADRPWWIKVHGHQGVRLLDLTAGGRKPTGPDFVAAVRKLAELAGVPFPGRPPTPEEAARSRALDERRHVLEAVADHAQASLMSEAGAAARRYLVEERGFTDDDLRDLELGLYLDSTTVRSALAPLGLETVAIGEAGVLWEKLEGYVLLPWRDAAGRVLTFYGRWPAKTPPEGKPKTIALPGADTKGVPLYFDRARRSGGDEVVVVEGIFDAAMCQARGDARVVASVAAQLNGNQLDALVRHGVKRAIVCGDPDGGGDKGNEDNVRALMKAGIAAFVAPRLPEGLDPDELVKRDGIEAWKAHVGRAVSGARFLVERALGEVKPESPDLDRTRAVESAVLEIATLAPSNLDHESLVAVVAERTGYAKKGVAGQLRIQGAKRDETAKTKATETAPPTESGGSGGAIEFEEPEPWSDPVEGAALLDEFAAVVRRYLVVPVVAHYVMALWILHTYLLDACEHTPRLAFESPQKRCGKSRALGILKAGVCRPLLTANVTAPALFRTIEAYRPTLLIDEADTFLAASEELRGVLNAGFEPDGAVVRTTGDDHEPRRFAAFAPAALAAIGRLPGTIEDRAISVEMKRRKKGEPVERLRRKHLERDLAETRRKALRWAQDNSEALAASDPTVPSELDDRAADCWRPLLAIADAAGGEWPARARTAARTLSGGRDGDDEELGVLLLADLRDLFQRCGTDRLTTKQIVADLLELGDRPWREVGKSEKPLTDRKLAAFLKPFGVKPGTIRLDDGTTPKGYPFAAFEDAFGRYLPTIRGATAPQPSVDMELRKERSATPEDRVADRDDKEVPTTQSHGVVASERPGSEPSEDRGGYVFDPSEGRDDLEPQDSSGELFTRSGERWEH